MPLLGALVIDVFGACKGRSEGSLWEELQDDGFHSLHLDVRVLKFFCHKYLNAPLLLVDLDVSLEP